MTLLSSMTILSVVSVVQTLIPSGRVLAHLPQPSEVQLILHTLKDLVVRIFEGHINTLGPWRQVQTRGFAFALQPIVLQPLMLLNSSH